MRISSFWLYLKGVRVIFPALRAKNTYSGRNDAVTLHLLEECETNAHWRLSIREIFFNRLQMFHSCRFVSNMDVSIRKAKFQDFETIVELSQNIYDGLDYLPHTFNIWLENEENGTVQMKNFGKTQGKEWSRHFSRCLQYFLLLPREKWRSHGLVWGQKFS